MIRKLSAVTAAAMLCSLALPALPASALSGTAAAEPGRRRPARRQPALQRRRSRTATPARCWVARTSTASWSRCRPTSASRRSPAPPRPRGWTVARFDNGTSQSYLFRTDGAGLAPNAKLAFPFPASVLAPHDPRPAGSVQGLGLRGQGPDRQGGRRRAHLHRSASWTSRRRRCAVSPPPVCTDGSGTAGQSIDYAVKVTNYARSAVARDAGPAQRQHLRHLLDGPPGRERQHPGRLEHRVHRARPSWAARPTATRSSPRRPPRPTRPPPPTPPPSRSRRRPA